MAQLGRGAQRLAEVQQQPPGGPHPIAWYEPAIVAGMSGTASDGNTLCTVTWRGGTYEASYTTGYTPVVGHTVLLLVQWPQLVVHVRVIGTP
jgi:hypothetical protein